MNRQLTEPSAGGDQPARLRLLAANVVRFYACWFAIFVGGLVMLTGGVTAAILQSIVMLAAALAPTAVLSSLTVVLLPPFRRTRWIGAAVAAGLSYSTVVIFSLPSNPPPAVVPIVVSPFNLFNLLAILSGIVFAAIARRSTESRVTSTPLEPT